MSESEFPTPEEEVDSITAEELKSNIDADDEVTILDVRTENEFEKWRIDGDSVTNSNVPYFEFLTDEPDEELFEDIPEDERVTVLCAKGGASEYVAGLLKERGYDVNHLGSGMNGWANIYEYHELDTDSDATIAQYRRPSSGCLSYLVVNDDEAAVIDPLRAFAGTYVQDARALGAELEYAIDTHIHADHISGVRTLAAKTGAEAVIPAPAANRGVEYDIEYATVEDGDELSVGETNIEVIHTPGHTTGMTSYRVDDVLFTGDGLFTESVARPDLEEGADGAPDAAGTLYDSLQNEVLTLPDETFVAPAHFSDAATAREDGTYTATIAELTESIDALSMERDEFVEFILSDVPPRPANYEDIIETNMGLKDADDEEAFELELGPNNCAASQDTMTSD